MSDNNFGPTTIRGAFRNLDYTNGSVQCSAYFQRDLTVGGSIITPNLNQSGSYLSIELVYNLTYPLYENYIFSNAAATITIPNVTTSNIGAVICITALENILLNFGTTQLLLINGSGVPISAYTLLQYSTLSLLAISVNYWVQTDINIDYTDATYATITDLGILDTTVSDIGYNISGITYSGGIITINNYLNVNGPLFSFGGLTTTNF